MHNARQNVLLCTCDLVNCPRNVAIYFKKQCSFVFVFPRTNTFLNVQFYATTLVSGKSEKAGGLDLHGPNAIHWFSTYIFQY